MSTDYDLIEVKDAKRTYTLKGMELEDLFVRSTRQNKSAVFIVYFRDADVTATITVARGEPS
jgi:hypothetical protein